MTKHQWYLPEELVVHRFFDDDVSFEAKQQILAKLQNEDNEQNFLKKPQHPLGLLKNKHPQDFVITKPKNFFEILQFDSKFLNEDPKFWLNRKLLIYKIDCQKLEELGY